MTKIKHPYIKFEKTKLWSTIKSAVDDLVENQDLEVSTHDKYVIGYICNAVNKNHNIADKKKRITTKQYNKEINESIQQVKEGKTATHASILKHSKKWLKR
jgi:hypothetical protein